MLFSSSLSPFLSFFLSVSFSSFIFSYPLLFLFSPLLSLAFLPVFFLSFSSSLHSSLSFPSPFFSLPSFQPFLPPFLFLSLFLSPLFSFRGTPGLVPRGPKQCWRLGPVSHTNNLLVPPVIFLRNGHSINSFQNQGEVTKPSSQSRDHLPESPETNPGICEWKAHERRRALSSEHAGPVRPDPVCGHRHLRPPFPPSLHPRGM